MIRVNSHQLLKLGLSTLLAIGLAPTSAVPVLAQTSGTWTTTGSMSTARQNHSATLLEDGVVLVSGGVDGTYLTSAELYDPSSGKWTITRSMNTARERHTSTQLQNGQVLVAGGNNASNFGQTSAEPYDPSTAKWTVTGSMNDARQSHPVTLLITGKVLVAGGDNFNTNLSSAELYDKRGRAPFHVVDNHLTIRIHSTSARSIKVEDNDSLCLDVLRQSEASVERGKLCRSVEKSHDPLARL